MQGPRKLDQGDSMERVTFKGCLAHAHRGSCMRTRAYIVSCVGDVTMLHIGHVGLEVATEVAWGFVGACAALAPRSASQSAG